MHKIHTVTDYFVNITDIAEEDILSAVDYITNILGAPKAAGNLLDEIEKEEKRLEKNPDFHPFVSDAYLAKKGVKFAKINNYKMFFVIKQAQKTVDVIRFLYNRRDWQNILKDVFRD